MKIFISHSSHDRWVATQISHILVADGHHTFLDEKDLRTGDSIDGSIRAHLRESDHLLVLISPASLKSQWVFVEVGGAMALGLRVVPILMNVGPNEVPPLIAQWLARDINDFDRYQMELGSEAAARLRGPVEAARHGAAHDGDSGGAPAAMTSRAATNTPSFVVGDRVRIVDASRLTDEEKAEFPVWVAGMDKFSGLETQVTKVETPDGYLRIAADEQSFQWSPSWLAKVT